MSKPTFLDPLILKLNVGKQVCEMELTDVTYFLLKCQYANCATFFPRDEEIPPHYTIAIYCKMFRQLKSTTGGPSQSAGVHQIISKEHIVKCHSGRHICLENIFCCNCIKTWMVGSETPLVRHYQWMSK